MTNLPRTSIRSGALILVALIFIAAGVTHFTNPDFFVAIVPPYLPAPLTLVYISGLFEILGGLGVLYPPTRRWAGIGLILLLIAVFPANVYMALNPELFTELSPAIGLYIRLPLQLLLGWFVWVAAISEKSQTV